MESTTAAATTTTTTATDQAKVIQHVNKVSSDQLLRKFAAMEEDYLSKKKQDDILKREKKRCRKDNDVNKENENSPSRNMIVERRSLLPVTNRRSSSGILRKIGIGRSSQVIKAREMKNKSFVRAIGKTWRKTVEGASKVFVEKHYNRHNRLISDFV